MNHESILLTMMMKNALSVTALAAVAALGMFTGCTTESTQPGTAGTYYGSAITVGGGSARTFVVIDNTGNPSTVGIAINEAAMNSLPADESEYDLSFPSQASATGYDNVLLNWNPHGHPPGVYLLPHFDIHFYGISHSARHAIELEDSTAGLAQPDAAEIPADYISTGEVVPMMGVHWVDPSSAEFHGETFTKTFIYGFWKGDMIFTEPMITRDYLLSKPNVTTTLKLPASYPKTGVSYATKSSIRYDEGTKEYVITLDGLVKR